MPAIKIKTGNCIDCGPDTPDKPLTAGRCQPHYWKYRAGLKSAKHKKTQLSVDKFSQKKALDLWFNNQINQMPKHCENCSEYLNQFAPWGARSYIAHILPKRNFDSVSIHPDNRLFLCIQCHTNFDNWPNEKVIKMPVFVLAVERLLSFRQHIQFEELRFLPQCFEQIISDEINNT